MDDSPAAGGLRPGDVPPGPCRSPETGRPLPDLMAIHLTDVTDSWPPYDDEVPAGPPAPQNAPLHAATSQATEAHPGVAGGTTRETRAAEQPRASGEDERCRPERGNGDAHADRWPSQFAQVLAETLAGSRPASQITPWTTERARAHIRRLGPLLAAEQRPRVQRVLTSRPVEDVVEVAVIVGFGPRTRALAARLERAGPQPATLGRPARQARWLCTAVESA